MPKRQGSVSSTTPTPTPTPTVDQNVVRLRLAADAKPATQKTLRRKMPRRARVQSARVEFPLLEDDPERMQANAYQGLTAFRLVWEKYEHLKRLEENSGANPDLRRITATEAYVLLNDASRMMNPYRRTRR